MAKREDFKDLGAYGMTVINTKTDRRGTIVSDDWKVCTPDEVPVRYDGERGCIGTDWRDLCLFDFD